MDTEQIKQIEQTERTERTNCTCHKRSPLDTLTSYALLALALLALTGFTAKLATNAYESANAFLHTRAKVRAENAIVALELQNCTLQQAKLYRENIRLTK